MRLVYKFNIQGNDTLLDLCRTSKDLYNQALYALKNELKTNNKWLSYIQLNNLMQSTPNLEEQINYRLLKAQVSQQCLRQLDSNIKAYIKAIKDYAKHTNKYNGKPHFPKYKKDLNQLTYTNQCCTIKDGYIILSKTLRIRIPQYEIYGDRIKDFQQVRILPKDNDTFTIEIVYNDKEAVNTELRNDLYASIDLGVDNVVTLLRPEDKPLLYNGRQMKSKNQYFNKEISRLKSVLKDKKTSKRIRGLWSHRENQINDIFHKISREVVRELIRGKVGNIVVGYNSGWKDSIHISKRNNQTFVYIPHERFIKYLEYKCEMSGIKVIKTEESYTSKCDSLAGEEITKHEEYRGRRVKRGLYQSSTGRLINADVNGALNIMRKVVGDSEITSKIINSGWLFQPLRINVL